MVEAITPRIVLCIVMYPSDVDAGKVILSEDIVDGG